MVFHKIPDIAYVTLLSCFIIVFSAFGDRNLRKNSNSVSRALIDNLTHSIVGGFSWIIVLILMKKCLIRNMLSIIVCFLTSSLIDIDHFISARSYKLHDATHLDRRPVLHCTTLAIFLFLILHYLSKVLNVPCLNTLSWIVLISFLSHHIRDAHRRGLWFAPFGSTPPLSHNLYLGLNAVLPYLIYKSMMILDN